jgi:hypothetical protein
MSVRMVYDVIIKLLKVIWRNFEFVSCPEWLRLKSFSAYDKGSSSNVLREGGKKFKGEKTGPKFPSSSGTLWIAPFNVWKRYVFVSYSLCCMICVILIATVLSTGTALSGWFCVREAQCDLWNHVCNICTRVFVLWRIKSWLVCLESAQSASLIRLIVKQKLGRVYSVRSGASSVCLTRLDKRKNCVGCKTRTSLYCVSFVRENSCSPSFMRSETHVGLSKVYPPVLSSSKFEGVSKLGMIKTPRKSL